MVIGHYNIGVMEGVSVVIPTTGNRQTLIEAIDSVYGQEGTENVLLEVVIVNDGDRLDVDLSEYIEKDDFKIIYTGGSKGANFARNMGVEFSTYKWIAFLDDDDIWHSKKLWYQIKYREENSLSFCRKMFFTENANHIKRVSKVHSGNLFLFNYIGSTSSVFLSREKFNQIGGFREDLPALQDWELYLRLYEAGVQFDYIKETHIKYRLSPNGRISTNISKQFRAAVKLIEKDCPRPIFLFGLIFHLCRVTWNHRFFRF